MDTKAVKFVSNDDTNLKCLPASMTMILNTLSDKEYALEDVVKLSGMLPGMSVWPARILLELQKLGFESVMIESFDANRFVEEGERYLKDEFGEEAASWQIAHSDIPKEQADYRELMDSGVCIVHREPVLDDIAQHLNDGWMVKCTVNSSRLVNKPGYVGHSVIVLCVDDKEVILHNPGLPPQPNQHVSLEDFEAAWASPNKKAKEMIAVRKLQ